MTKDLLNQQVTFTSHTKSAFLQYVYAHPSSRRISLAEKENLIGWLTDSRKEPHDQKEFSRRYYAKKTFAWDEDNRTLIAIAKENCEKGRIVVTEDLIATLIERVHNENGHAGWDATWRDVSNSYYGILRSDVNFLLKQCQICAGNPRKRPKGLATTLATDPPANHRADDFVDFENLLPYDQATVESRGRKSACM